MSDILPFSTNLFIQNCSPSTFKINSSGSFSIDYNFLLLNSFFSFNKDDVVCGAYLLTSMSQAILQFPSGKYALLAFLANPNVTLPTEELVLIKRIKSSNASLFASPNFINFCWGPYNPPLYSHIHSQKEPYPCLTWAHYLPEASYALSTFHAKGTSKTNIPNRFSYPKIQ